MKLGLTVLKVFILTLCFILAVPVMAAVNENIPPQVYRGTIAINGHPAPVGTVLEARGEGVLTGITGNPVTTAEEGLYGASTATKLQVQGDISEGTVISFYVDGTAADQTSTWTSGTLTWLDLTFTIPDSRIETSLTLTSSRNPSTRGKSVTFTAEVAPAVSQDLPSGTITFYDNDEVLGTSDLDGTGRAVIDTSSLSTGTHTIKAVYPGNDSFMGSKGTLSQTVKSSSSGGSGSGSSGSSAADVPYTTSPEESQTPAPTSTPARAETPQSTGTPVSSWTPAATVTPLPYSAAGPAATPPYSTAEAGTSNGPTATRQPAAASASPSPEKEKPSSVFSWWLIVIIVVVCLALGLFVGKILANRKK